MSKSEIVIYSDGGGEKTSAAAGACIVDCDLGRIQAVVFLGKATNNEAEICGGLLGYSLLRALEDKISLETNIRWVCDSEYVLKSATAYINTWQKNGWRTASKQPVKNQALWHCYLELSKGLKITPEHVRGHTGHPENEACDAAATWAQQRAAELLEQSGEGLHLDSPGGDWILLDGREFIETLRDFAEAKPPTEELLALVDSLKVVGVLDSNGKAKVISENKTGSNGSLNQVKKLTDALSTAIKQAKLLENKDEQFNRIVIRLTELLEETKKMR